VLKELSMKSTTQVVNRFLLAAFCIGLSVVTARGHDGGNGGGSNGDDKNVEIELAMTPTADAPPNSSIKLSFQADNEDGVQTAELKLEPRNLPAATYSVGVTLKDGTSVVVGTFTVDNEGEGEIEFGHDGNPFPANINPQDIASVTVSGVNGVVLFRADLSSLTSATSMNINVSKEATPGPGVPNATGNVLLNAFLSKGKVKGSLQLIGHGLPPNINVLVAVNGIPVKRLHTSNTGDVIVKLGPKGKTGTIGSGLTLAGVTTVTLTDLSGNVLLQVNL
jgi:hypothetical protein